MPEKLDPNNLTGPQKAAIFLITMGEEFTAEVYKYLSEEEIKRIGIEMAKLDYIPAEVVRRVLEEANVESRELLADITVPTDEFLEESLLK
ncbi:MAG TPA: flagellar motor switch protein FliG, partial [Thermodesulfatator sp.]|nr:flagellar motor switch protein FliG [Thermodesulfatator sp.]